MRPRVKGKKRQTAILDLFEPLARGVTEDSLARFAKAFSAIKNRDHNERLRCEEGTIAFQGFTEEWYEGPKHLMKAIVFASSGGDYLHLGFDMRRIGWEPPTCSPSRKERALWKRQEALENLVDALGPVFFISDRSWAKYRPHTDNEIFTFQFSEESHSTLRPVTSDEEWDLPA